MRGIKVILSVAVLLSAVACKKDPTVEPVDPGQQIEVPSAGSIVQNIAIDTDNLGGAKGVFSIYLPANYATSGKKYPVLYLLHGMGGDNNDWINNNTLTVTNNAVVKLVCPELIVVMPDGNNDFYVDGYTSGIRYDTFFQKDLIPYIESHYPCLTDKNSRAVAGLSMGGYGAVYHAFTCPDKFCLAYSMSGAVMGVGSAATPSLQKIFEDKGYSFSNFASLPELVLECGSEDPLCLGANILLHNYLLSVQFEHTYTLRTGTHDWVFWRACYPKLLRKLNDYFKTD